MNSKLSRHFSISFFVSLVEMSLYNAYLILFISSKGVDNAFITKMISLNFIVSLVFVPIVGKLIDRVENKKVIVLLSTVIYILSILLLIGTTNKAGILVSNILYNLSKMPLMRLQEMLGAQAHYKGEIDFGDTRSKAAIGYAFAPMALSSIWITLGYTSPLYSLIMSVMIISMLVNNLILIKISNGVQLPKVNGKKFIWKDIPMRQITFLTFIVLSNVFYNSTNNFIVTFQSIYFSDVFKTTQYIGLVILVGSILEWPVMKKTSKIVQSLGYMNVFLLLSIIQSTRWLLYYFSGSKISISIFLLAASLNGVLQAIYIPVYTMFLRENSDDENYSTNYTIISITSSLFMWVNSQLIATVQTKISMQNMFLFMILISSFWSVLILFFRKKDFENPSTR